MWALWACACLALAVLGRQLLRWAARHGRLRRRLAHFPGPAPLPVIGNVIDVGFDANAVVYNSLRLWRTYGPIVRVWLGPEPLVCLSDPRDVEMVLSDVKYIDKSVLYSYIEPWLGTGLLTSTGEKWHMHRKLITPTFHFKILESFMDVFNKQGDTLISKLQQEVTNECFDISEYIDLYTHDVICETAMGVNVNSQNKNDESSEYVRAVHSQTDCILQRIMRPWYYFDTLFNMSTLGRKQAKNLNILHGATRQVITERRKILENNGQTLEELTANDSGIKKRFVFLDILLLSSDKGKVLTDVDIREEVDTFMFEGHDTTSSAICFTLYELSTHKDVQDRLFEELQRVMGDEYSATLDKMSELKYLECVAKEGLRLYPSVPLFSRKLKHDVSLKTKKLTIPAGVTVGISPFSVHRHPEFFPEPDKFDPERFLPAKALGRHAYAYIPFSGGPRNCIGQRFALLEMKSAISKVIWNFELVADPQFKPELMMGLTLKSANGIRLRMIPRRT